MGDLALLGGHAIELLDPTTLTSEAEEHLRAIWEAGESANTARSDRSSLSYLTGYSLARFGTPLPLPTPVTWVLQYLADHVRVDNPNQEGFIDPTLPDAIHDVMANAGFRKAKVRVQKLSTVLQRLNVLSKQHTVQKLENPLKHSGVKEVIGRAKRCCTQGVRQKTAATKKEVELVLDSLDYSILIDVRDAAYISMSFAGGGRRVVEMADLQYHQLHQKSNGEFGLQLGKTKTNQTGDRTKSREKPIRGRAAEILRLWLSMSRINEGFVFRRVVKNKVSGDRIRTKALSTRVTKRFNDVGIPGEFSGISLRRGFITECGKQNIPILDVMAMSEHRTYETVRRYYQEGELSSSPVSGLLD